MKQGLKALDVKRTETDEGFAYLDELKYGETKKCPCTKPEDFLSLERIKEALKVSVSHKVRKVLNLYSSSKASKKDFVNSLYALDVVEATEEHIRYVSFVYFMNRIGQKDITCEGIKRNLTNLCMLYGLHNLYKDSKSCYEAGYFGNKPYSEYMLEAIKLLNKEIRPVALSIIEAPEIHDMFL